MPAPRRTRALSSWRGRAVIGIEKQKLRFDRRAGVRTTRVRCSLVGHSRMRVRRAARTLDDLTLEKLFSLSRQVGRAKEGACSDSEDHIADSKPEDRTAGHASPWAYAGTTW